MSPYANTLTKRTYGLYIKDSRIYRVNPEESGKCNDYPSHRSRVEISTTRSAEQQLGTVRKHGSFLLMI